jgi:hypothetical protein
VRGVGLAGVIAIAFGLGSYYVTGELGRFAQVNLLAGGAVFALSALLSLRRLRGLGSPATRGALARRTAEILAVAALALGLERGADALGLRFDWTLERRFTLAPATLAALRALPDDLVATLYYEVGDPRLRGTQLLLSELAATGELEVRERDLDAADADLERFGALVSNAVVLESQGRHVIVPRPTEGTLWEGLQELAAHENAATVYFARGEGEGDPTRGDPTGWSGAAAALANERYAVRELVLAAASAIPDDAAALILAAPRRRLRPETVALVGSWLARGGGLVVLLEPGVETGLEPLLEEWGFALPDGVIVDPASGPIEGGAPGVNPLLHAYADHAVTRELDANRMTFFVQARPAAAVRKPAPEDELTSIVFTSPRAWLSQDVERVARGLAPSDAGAAEPQRFAVAAAGRYAREGGESRIAVFGDGDFASNRHLRTLYNLDLFLNAVHWVARREPDITRRAKLLTPVQRPLTVQESLSMFYGVGLLLPELLLVGAALAWARRRSA